MGRNQQPIMNLMIRTKVGFRGHCRGQYLTGSYTSSELSFESAFTSFPTDQWPRSISLECLSPSNTRGQPALAFLAPRLRVLRPRASLGSGTLQVEKRHQPVALENEKPAHDIPDVAPAHALRRSSAISSASTTRKGSNPEISVDALRPCRILVTT